MVINMFKDSSASVSLISMVIVDDRACKFFPVFLLFLFGLTFEFSCGVFPLYEDLLAIGFPECFVESLFFVSFFLLLTASPKFREVFFYFMTGIANYKTVRFSM